MIIGVGAAPQSRKAPVAVLAQSLGDEATAEVEYLKGDRCGARQFEQVIGELKNVVYTVAIGAEDRRACR